MREKLAAIAAINIKGTKLYCQLRIDAPEIMDQIRRITHPNLKIVYVSPNKYQKLLKSSQLQTQHNMLVNMLNSTKFAVAGGIVFVDLAGPSEQYPGIIIGFEASELRGTYVTPTKQQWNLVKERVFQWLESNLE